MGREGMEKVVGEAESEEVGGVGGGRQKGWG